MNEDRLCRLNSAPPDRKGAYVLYWMQQSQRAESNPALEYAIGAANALNQRLIVGFGLTAEYPEANRRHFAFMLEGLAETAARLQERGIKVVARLGNPEQVALALARQASMVVCDRGYLRHQRQWRRYVAANAGKRVVQIEGDVVVPVQSASDKREYAARTFRPKIQRLHKAFLSAPRKIDPRKSSLPLAVRSDLDLKQPETVLQQLATDDTVGRSTRFIGGTFQARRRLKRFILKHLNGYGDARNDPGDPQCSELSPYLHFGQLSPIEAALKIVSAKSGSPADKEAFLEELIVRRELAVNFVYYEPHYDTYASLPRWAKQTLDQHKSDPRPYRYTRRQLENAATHDAAWNAAMTEMRTTGYMHNYMRMYWGKKIIEWSGAPSRAHATALYLNNKYFIDGRDPCSYANIAWLFGLHDRPWKEREVFGKVRYMNENGLRRKFDVEAYIRRTNALA